MYKIITEQKLAAQIPKNAQSQTNSLMSLSVEYMAEKAASYISPVFRLTCAL